MHVPNSETYCAAAAAHGAVTTLHTAGVGAEDFAQPGPHAVVSVAETLQERGEQVTPAAVRHLLRQKEVWEQLGGQEWWSAFIGTCGDMDELKTHIRDVRAASTVRDVMEPTGEISKVATNGHSPRDALDEIGDLTGDLLQAQSETTEQVYDGEALASGITDMLTSEEPQDLFMPVGWPSFDETFDGLPVGRLNVIAARTNHGKSAAVDQVALNVARRWHGDRPERQVVKFDLENSPTGVQTRYAANLSGVPAQAIKRHAQHKERLADPQFQDVCDAADRLQELPLTVDTTSGADSRYIRSRVLSEDAKTEVGLVVVDYLTQMGERGDGAMEKVMHAVSGLHQLARDLEIPVLAVSQINREPVKGSDPEPKLHHLSWSDDVAQVPAQVIMLHHHLAHWDQTDRQTGTRPDPEKLSVYVRKNKGPTGPTELRFRKDCLRITDANDPQPYQENAPF